jgi:hypothetical protein
MIEWHNSEFAANEIEVLPAWTCWSRWPYRCCAIVNRMLLADQLIVLATREA